MKRARSVASTIACVLFVGCAMGARDTRHDEASETRTEQASGGDSAYERSATSAPSVESEPSGAGMAPRAPVAPEAPVPTTSTVETVQVGRATSDDASPTVGGNAGAGSVWARLVDTEDDLHDALGLASVDCGTARELRDRICELGDRICDIASDHPDDDVTEDRCEDGRDRCRNASRRVESRCD